MVLSAAAAAAASPDKIRLEIYWIQYCKRDDGILKLEDQDL
jgi:hypothetical protein